LIDHRQKRAQIIRYALERSEYVDHGAWSMDSRPEPPAFWQVPEKAVVDPHKRNETQWYHIVGDMKDKLIA